MNRTGVSDIASVPSTGRSLPPESRDAMRHFLRSLEEGGAWPEALLEAMALWTAPDEQHNGRRFQYLIQGEAFDWLQLAERLCLEADGAIPADERDQLLFRGQLPPFITENRFKELLGGPKHRAYLNYWYGVVVEEALLLAVENEVRKERHCQGLVDQEEVDDQVYQRIYGAGPEALLKEFWREKGVRPRRSVTLTQHKEFTYWLFKCRLRICDRARIASDTRKGLQQLNRLRRAVEAEND